MPGTTVLAPPTSRDKIIVLERSLSAEAVAAARRPNYVLLSSPIMTPFAALPPPFPKSIASILIFVGKT